MTKHRRKGHLAARSEQTLRKAVRTAQEQPARKISPALPAAIPRVRQRKGSSRG
jgi:hypothetical protein